MSNTQLLAATTGPLARAFEQDKYTRSLCYLLAWHLHALTGWTLASMHSLPGQPGHAFVVDLTRNYAIDIEGLHTTDHLLERWNTRDFATHGPEDFCGQWQGLKRILANQVPGNEELSAWTSQDAQTLVANLESALIALGLDFSQSNKSRVSSSTLASLPITNP